MHHMMIRFDKHGKQVNQGEQNRLLLHHPHMYLQPTQIDHFKPSATEQESRFFFYKEVYTLGLM